MQGSLRIAVLHGPVGFYSLPREILQSSSLSLSPKNLKTLLFCKAFGFTLLAGMKITAVTILLSAASTE